MSLNSKVRAFTLLECLVALLVIAGSIQVYQGLTTVLVLICSKIRPLTSTKTAIATRLSIRI